MLAKHVALLKDRSKRIDEIVDTGLYFWREPDAYEEKAVAKYWKPETKERMSKLLAKLESAEWNHAALEGLYRTEVEEQGIKFADLIHPTRLAVSGMSFGPGLFELLEALEKDTVLRRIKSALEKLG